MHCQAFGGQWHTSFVNLLLPASEDSDISAGTTRQVGCVIRNPLASENNLSSALPCADLRSEFVSPFQMPLSVQIVGLVIRRYWFRLCLPWETIRCLEISDSEKYSACFWKICRIFKKGMTQCYSGILHHVLWSALAQWLSISRCVFYADTWSTPPHGL